MDAYGGASRRRTPSGKPLKSLYVLGLIRVIRG
jgi:hypothetical protein